MTESGDYISREAAYESLLNGMVMTGYQSRALDCISEFSIPAADVLPVVLCRDCIFRSNEWTGCPKLNGTITGDEFFCKCGIKREES